LAKTAVYFKSKIIKRVCLKKEIGHVVKKENWNIKQKVYIKKEVCSNHSIITNYKKLCGIH
jgi:hypothetical protein